MTTSTKQKLNTRSSTETEVVAVDDVMPLILWTNYFLEAQDYGTKETVLYQDNQSAILLEKNGRKSSSKRTKHINLRYYFVTDRIASKELQVQHCPTETMTADYLTKPLQGEMFLKFRNVIMNVKEDTTMSLTTGVCWNITKTKATKLAKMEKSVRDSDGETENNQASEESLGKE